jgi:probable HAF family extracellular repeat protein
MFTRGRITILCVLVTALLLQLVATPSAVVPSFYQVTDLGTLNGDFCSGNVGRSSFATALNDDGRVVGGSCAFVGFFQRVTHAMSWSDGSMTDVGTLGLGNDRSPDQSVANGINNAGLIVGRNFINDAAGTSDVAVLWSSGTATRLDTVIGGDFSSALDINNTGQIVGLRGFLPDIASWSAFQYDTRSGQMTALPGLGGTFRSVATSINDLGDAVGYATTLLNATHAVRWRSLVPTDLGTLGGTHSFANGINIAGDVVGESWMPGDTGSHAFLYSAGMMHDLGTLGGGSSSASGINDSGQIVGTASTSTNEQHAFISDGGVMIDLNSLIASSGWVLVQATAINASGAVVGIGRINNETHAFLLSPTETPPADLMPPVLHIPSNLTVPAFNADGAVVYYAATATDDVDHNPTVTCVPPSGSLFAVGTRTVLCTATDNTGKSTSASFTVTVIPPLDISIEFGSKLARDSRTGIVTVAGTVACNRSTFVSISGQVTEVVAHRAALQAGFFTSVMCVAPATAWSTTAAASNGSFGAGPAEVSAQAFACDFSCDNDQRTKSVLVVGKAK